MASKFFVYNLATGTLLHILIDEPSTRKYIKHFEKHDMAHEGGPLAVVAWEPGRIEVLNWGTV
jgi:TusA-related sulfurtransferase